MMLTSTLGGGGAREIDIVDTVDTVGRLLSACRSVFARFPASSLPFSSLIDGHRVAPGCIGFCSGWSRPWIGFHPIGFEFTGFYSVSRSFNGFLTSLTGFYWVLPSFTGFYLVLLGFP